MLSCRSNDRFFEDFDSKLVESSQKFDFEKDLVTRLNMLGAGLERVIGVSFN